jgi:hypothetical protein
MAISEEEMTDYHCRKDAARENKRNLLLFGLLCLVAGIALGW